jgi:RimJ/RimL family protein N-acetyltransferase
MDRQVIRTALLADVPRIVEMGRQFLAASPYSQWYADAPEKMRDLAVGLIQQAGSTILVVDDGPQVIGMIGLTVFAHPISGERMATEHFWWMDEAHRGAGVDLLQAAEAWAKRQGATSLQMMAPNKLVARYYRMAGFEQVETIHQKRIA